MIHPLDLHIIVSAVDLGVLCNADVNIFVNDSPQGSRAHVMDGALAQITNDAL